MSGTVQQRSDGFINLNQLMALNPNPRSRKSFNSYLGSNRGKKILKVLQDTGLKKKQIFYYESDTFWGCKSLAIDIADWIDPVLGVMASRKF